LLWLPPAIAAACIVIAIGEGFLLTILAPQPENPWESGQVVEAWRTLHGSPVYEWPDSGHATHCYGALAPWVLGAAFRLTGPTIWTGRVLELSCALALVGILLTICRRWRSYSWPVAMVAGALFLGLDASSGHYFVQNRPDMMALLVGVVGLVLLYRASQGAGWVHYTMGIVLLLLGCLLKQTAAMLSLVPAAPFLLDKSRRPIARISLAFGPLVSVALLFLVLRAAYPVVYYYMVAMMKAYRVLPSKAAEGILLLARAIPLFLVCIAVWVRRDNPQREPLMTWVLSALFITIPASVVAFGKQGGAPNSLLPALFAMALFSALYLPELLAPIADPAIRPSRRLAFSGIVGLFLLIGALEGIINVTHHPRYADYPVVVEKIAALAPQRVVAPEDPTIPLLALGTAGRNIYLELDALGRPPQWPRYLVEEIRNADYVVDVRNWWEDLVPEEMLRQLGFEIVSRFDHYSIWRRRNTPAPESRLDVRCLKRMG